jgi:hypothetical protein
MLKLIEIVKRWINIRFCYLYHYYHQKIRSSPTLLKIWSKWKGISIAEKYNQTIKIKYYFDGKEFEVYLPFERRLVSKMVNQSIHLVNENLEDTMMIKHQPGVPYFITPGHLGSKRAIIVNLSSEKQIQHNERIEV